MLSISPSFYSDYNEIELWRNLINKERELIKLMEDSDPCSKEVPAAGPAGQEDTRACPSWEPGTPAAASHQAVAPNPSSVVPAVAPGSAKEEVSPPEFNSKKDFPALGSRRRGTLPMSSPSNEDPAPSPSKVATPVPGLSYKQVASGVGPGYNITASVNGPRSYAEYDLRYGLGNRSVFSGAGPSNGISAPATGLSNGVGSPVPGSISRSEHYPVVGPSSETSAHKDNAPVASPSNYVGAPVNDTTSRIAASKPGLSNGLPSAPWPYCNGIAPPPGLSRHKAVPSPSNKVSSSVIGPSNGIASAPGPSNGMIIPKVGPCCGPTNSSAGPSCDKAAPTLLPNNKIPASPESANDKQVAGIAPIPAPSCKEVDSIPNPSRKAQDLIPGPNRKAHDLIPGPSCKAPDLMPGPSPKDPGPAPGPNRNEVLQELASKQRKFVPADPNEAAERRRADDAGLGFNVVAIGDDGVPEVSANGGYKVVEEGHEQVEEENESGEERNEVDDEADDEISEESEDSPVESDVDSCYFSSEGEDNVRVFVLAARPAFPWQRPRFLGYYICRCYRY